MNRRDRSLLTVGALVVLAGWAAPARAAVDLLWTTPELTQPTYHAESPCTDEAGGQSLVATVTVPESHAIHEIEAVIDYCSGFEPLPHWWQYDVAHRGSALSVVAGVTPGSGSPFVDPWGGAVDATLTWEMTAYNMARIVVHVVLPEATTVTLNPGSNYAAFRLDIANAGTAANSGCNIGVCLVLNDLRIIGPGVDIRQHQVEPSQFRMTYWQTGVTGCPFIVPVQPTTWSGIKATYR